MQRTSLREKTDSPTASFSLDRVSQSVMYTLKQSLKRHTVPGRSPIAWICRESEEHELSLFYMNLNHSELKKNDDAEVSSLSCKRQLTINYLVKCYCYSFFSQHTILNRGRGLLLGSLFPKSIDN